MRCLRLSATIQSSFCLKKQAEMERYVKARRKYATGNNALVPNVISHVCFKCPQGETIKKIGGSMEEEDIERLREAMKRKEDFGPNGDGTTPGFFQRSPPVALELPLTDPVEGETVELKTCRDCGVPKETSLFYRTRKGQGLDPSCKACRKKEADTRRRRQIEERKAARVDSMTNDKEVKFGIEVGGRRVWVCQDCLRRYLKG